MQKNNILIVEDSTSMGRFLSIFFSKTNKVTLCECPLDAIKKIEAGLRPCAIITDLQMPGMDGYEYLRQMRKMLPSTPLMVLSGMKDSKSRLEALRSGADDYMTKPFLPAELEVRVSKMIGSKPKTTPARLSLPTFLNFASAR